MNAHDRTRLIGPSRKFEKQARKSDERRVAGIYLLEGLPKKDAVFFREEEQQTERGRRFFRKRRKTEFASTRARTTEPGL